MLCRLLYLCVLAALVGARLPDLELNSPLLHPQNMRIALITAETRNSSFLFDRRLWDQMDEEYDELLHLSTDYTELFKQNKKEWSNFQGYDYIHTEIDTDFDLNTMSLQAVRQSLSWVKMDLLQKYAQQYDWVCWLDMDTLIIDMNIRLEDYIRDAIRYRPGVDLILEGTEEFKQMDGTAIRSGVMLIRNSYWSQHFLSQVKDILADHEWENVLSSVMKRRSESVLDNALAFLLNSEHAVDSHISFRQFQDRWDQSVIYLPKVGILHFSGCTIADRTCIEVLDRAVVHLISHKQTYVYMVAPYVQHIYNIFAGIYVLFAIDRLFHILGRYVWPSRSSKLPKVVLPDRGRDDSQYPMVVVQLPMYNETSCCQTIIDCACQLDWPSDKLYIQVVDDSTSEDTKRMIDTRVNLWRSQGIDIEVLRRVHRSGFKAGAMNDAMIYFPPNTEYVTIFDADFLPQPDFLRRTVPFLIATPNAAFVQTRWIYTNAYESLLTRMQEISLNFHFRCEQEMRFRTHNFFNFNGTAGVWRLRAIDSVGGWHTDTLVEDMDLSLRAWAAGWQFLYLNNVTVLNEIPPTFGAYLGQQHRWTSGPMQVLKKAFRTIYASDYLSRRNKLFCLWFFLRNYVHMVNFLYFLILIPTMIWIPRVTLYEWAVVYLPAAISMTNVFFTPNAWYYVVHYVLFENAMCLYKVYILLQILFISD